MIYVDNKELSVILEMNMFTASRIFVSEKYLK